MSQCKSRPKIRVLRPIWPSQIFWVKYSNFHIMSFRREIFAISKYMVEDHQNAINDQWPMTKTTSKTNLIPSNILSNKGQFWFDESFFDFFVFHLLVHDGRSWKFKIQMKTRVLIPIWILQFFLHKKITFHVEVLQKQSPEMFYKKAVLKIFTTFTEKHLCWTLFLVKLLTFQVFRHATLLKKSIQQRPDTLLKRDSNTGVFLGNF